MSLTPAVSPYNFGQRRCAFGPIIIDGFAKGSGIEIEQPDSYGDKVGDDGHLCRYAMLDHSISFTLHLMWSSATNDALSLIWQLSRGAGVTFLEDVMPFIYVDGSGRTNIQVRQAWITAAPNLSIAAEPGDRAWKFRGNGVVRLDGGN